MSVSGGQGKKRKGKPKQGSAAGARAVAAARGTRTDMTKIIIGLVVIVVVAAAVVGGIIFEKAQSDQKNLSIIPALTVSGSDKDPVSFDKSNATVTVGKPTAKISIEAYEDFLCPICGEFESGNFNALEQQIQAGTVKIRYHMINLLDTHSDPPGYSLQAADTAMAVAQVDPQKFIDFHYSLYKKQPAENGAGWTQAQLSNLANRLGVSGPAFDSLISKQTYANQIKTNLNNAANDKSLWMPGQSGLATPTVIANGQFVNWQQDQNWLSTLVKTNYPS